jgi:glc operon protein GlcG
MLNRRLTSLLVLMSVFCGVNALAQTPGPYGPPVSLENAKKVSAAAAAEARKNNWTVAIAIVDPSGTLVYYEKMDNTQLGSAQVAVKKARSAALFKRSTKLFQDRLTSGNAGLPVLAVAIGVSGDSSEHDGQCAQMGVDSLK